MRRQSMVGLVRKGRRLWQRGSLLSREDLSPQLCVCYAFHSTHQGMQHGDVQSSNIRAHLASPPVYNGHVIQNGGLLCFCTHRLGDVLIINKTLGSCTGGQCSNKNTTMDCFIRGHYGAFSYAKPFHTTTFEPASTNSNNALGETLSKISVFGATSSLKYSSSFINSLPQLRKFCSGLWNRRRRNSPWIGRRSFLSAANHKTSSDLGLGSLEDCVPAVNVAEAETNTSLPNSDEDFDFRNFPALKSSFYQDYERPIEMQQKKRVIRQPSRKLLNTDSKLTVEAIPQPKGRTYDFGLGEMSSKPPPLEAGARPQGGFDINISFDECEAVPPETPSSFLVFAQRMPSRNLPWDTPEADNWSEIGKDLRRDEASVWKTEQEFYWDPYEFDADVKLPHELESEQGLSVNVASQ